MYPEAGTTAPGRKAKSTTLLENKSVSFATLSQARTVLRLAPELADALLAGDMSLSEAYGKAGLLDGSAKTDRRRMKELRERRPELAAKAKCHA